MRMLCFFQAALLVPAGFSDPLTLTFAGDLMAHERNQSMRDYNDIYQGVAPWLLSDDLSFVNLETPVDAARVTSSYPRFNAKPSYVEAAIKGGFDVFSLANNHSNDFGVAGMEGTLKTMKALADAKGIVWSGLKHKAAEPLEPVVIEIKGWRVGFIALTNLLNRLEGGLRVNKVSLWNVWTRKVDTAGQEALLAQVREWKAQVDLLVVSLHDGIEYQSEPDPIQVEFDRKVVAAGADIFWGHHPHVLQRWEWVDTDRGRCLLLYSMGNFISRQTGNLGPKDAGVQQARTGDGALMRVTVTRAETAPTSVQLSVNPLMLSNYPDPEKGMVVLPTETLLLTAPERWKPYYRARWEAQKLWAAGD